MSSLAPKHAPSMGTGSNGGSGSQFESFAASRRVPDLHANLHGHDAEPHENVGYELDDLDPSPSRDALISRDERAQNGYDEDPNSDDADELLTGTARHQQRLRRLSAESFELYTPDEERRVRFKLDSRLVSFVALLYLMSFLDRSNIGNAKIAGLIDDLHLSDDQFEWLLSAFYISYVLFEWMTLCYKLFPPHIYISCCVFAWGILASLQSLTANFTSMLILRALLGIGEAAFVGIPFYLSFFFRRDELAFRTGLFVSAAPLATSFASSLAYAITLFADQTDIASWRLLFLLEGFPACLVAVWAWYWTADSPEDARWLNSRERKVAVLRLRRERPNAERIRITDTIGVKPKFQWTEVVNTLSDPKPYIAAGIFFCCNVAFSSMPVFLPTIVTRMGYSRLAAQGLSAPPFLFAFVVVIMTALISDRVRSRSIPIMVHAGLAMLGYLFLALSQALRAGSVLRYLAVFPICAGFFSAVTMVITWTINNQDSDEAKGTGLAMLNIIGQLGPLLGTRLYPDEDGPYFVKGMSVCALAMATVVVLSLALRIVLQRANASTQRQRRQGLSGQPGRGPESQAFVYMT